MRRRIFLFALWVRGPAAPRRQSLLRSQARCALLPAATPRLTFVLCTCGWLETPRGQRDGASEPTADARVDGAAWTGLEAQRVPAGAAWTRLEERVPARA